MPFFGPDFESVGILKHSYNADWFPFLALPKITANSLMMYLVKTGLLFLEWM